MANNLAVTGNVTIGGTLVVTGTTNLGAAADTVLVTNFNADKVDGADLDTDGALAANSDVKVPSQKAVKTYADARKAECVALTGDQTVAGVKTFSSIPVLPASDPTTANQTARKAYVDGLDAANVKLTGVQTIGGAKTLSDGAKLGEDGVVLKSKVLTFDFTSDQYVFVAHGLTAGKIRGVAPCPPIGDINLQYIRVDTTNVMLYMVSAATGTGYAIVFYVP